ncbi:uncharacterized protein LOC105704203 [Orussus abietinus]|uniref:uncharacterized protein LOC105704203 n=1 Tax=Orussus abietinus TaxID=222816 RepID=UPI000626C07C|nr:uncharacterized protein LOC105704203 [Orussus abietinus]
MAAVEAGFRLIDAPSECSLRSKARIDALFEDSRSVCSSTFGGWYGGAISTVEPTNPEDLTTEEQRKINGAVQARIEAMFASVEAEAGTPGECAAAVLQVRYLGAAPIGGRVTSIRGLQEPLRQHLERLHASQSAELEVSRRGLAFRTAGCCEKVNPFRRIAVWSALRLRSRRSPSGGLRYAFVPLVGDMSGSGPDDKHADLYRTMRGLRSVAEDYPPIFAVVMRRPGAPRLLECHAFACQTEEDAVAAAATLYRALLADLDANRRRPRHANGLGCVSLASVASSTREPSPSGKANGEILRPPPPRPTAPHPVRPPRAKKNSISSLTEDSGLSDQVEKAPRRKKVLDVQSENVSMIGSKKPTGEGSSTKNGVKTPTKDLAGQGNVTENLKKGTLSQKAVKGKLFDGEEMQNLKNKAQSKDEVTLGREEALTRKLNSYEKLPVRGKRVDQEPFNDDSVIKTEINVPAEEENLDQVQQTEERVYEKNRASYDLLHSSSDNLLSGGMEKYSRKMSSRIYESAEDEKTYQLATNDIYGQFSVKKQAKNEKLYEDRFLEFEKTYALGHADVPSAGMEKPGNCRKGNSRENLYQRMNPQDLATRRKAPCLSDESATGHRHRCRGQEDLCSGHKSESGRISTLDKPLRKSRDKLEAGKSKVPEYSQPRVRKRSRAGSEPPLSCSEDASKVLPEDKLKRSQSDLDVNRGDLMTRVELPRRGSFLNSGSVRRPNNVPGGTPLGFTELFDEFRNQEGLTSVDDILAAIIDPEGMSFNDLKPLYKEFLLKLAATLTQDELYERSASIMRRRRRPQRRRSVRRPCLLRRAIRRSMSRLKGGPTEFTSVIFPARRLNDSIDSSSSCGARNGHGNNRVLASRLGRRRPSWKRTKHVGQTTSEDSDTCRRLGRNVGAGANRSSSGYVSCSECSYDSESCTCVSADKCYCSLARRIPAPPAPVAVAVCSCDTDSCSESNKCYCARKSVQPTILEQLRQRGIVPSESTLSRGGSPERIRSSRNSRSHGSSTSLEFLKIRPTATPASSDNLALDYDLFNPGRKVAHSKGDEKVLLVSARDPQGRLVYVGGADGDKRSCKRGKNRHAGHHEALSIKKSAEIAAVFGANSNRSCRRSSISSLRSSISLEAGLGYLP